MSSRSVTIRSVVALGLALIALLLHRQALVVLLSLFGSYALVAGILALVSAAKHDAEYGRRWMMLEGIAGTLIGLATFATPYNPARTNLLDRDLGNHHGDLRDRRCDSYAQGYEAYMAVQAGWRTLRFLWDTVYWSAARGRLGRDLVVGRLRPAVWRCIAGFGLQSSQT